MSAQGGGCVDPSRPGVLRFGDLDVILPGTFTFRFPSLSHEQNRSCKYCGAVTWKEESINCCGDGKFVVHMLKHLPSGVMDVFRQQAFLKRQRTYNNMFCFTCLGASPGQTWTQPSYPSMLKLHGRPYHRIMDGFGQQHSHVHL